MRWGRVGCSLRVVGAMGALGRWPTCSSSVLPRLAYSSSRARSASTCRRANARTHESHAMVGARTRCPMPTAGGWRRQRPTTGTSGVQCQQLAGKRNAASNANRWQSSSSPRADDANWACRRRKLAEQQAHLPLQLAILPLELRHTLRIRRLDRALRQPRRRLQRRGGRTDTAAKRAERWRRQNVRREWGLPPRRSPRSSACKSPSIGAAARRARRTARPPAASTERERQDRQPNDSAGRQRSEPRRLRGRGAGLAAVRPWAPRLARKQKRLLRSFGRRLERDPAAACLLKDAIVRRHLRPEVAPHALAPRTFDGLVESTRERLRPESARPMRHVRPTARPPAAPPARRPQRRLLTPPTAQPHNRP